MCGHEGLTGKVFHPVTYIVMTRHDEAALLAVKGMGGEETDTTSIAVLVQFQSFNATSQELVIPHFLCSNIFTVDFGRRQ